MSIGPASFSAMKKFGWGLGFVLLLLAAASALAEIVTVARGGQGLISLGWIWFQIHGNGLVGFQALIEKNAARRPGSRSSIS